jgi:hypothetical protein
MTDFERFRELAIEDATLRDQLLAETETRVFVAAVIDTAREARTHRHRGRNPVGDRDRDAVLDREAGAVSGLHGCIPLGFDWQGSRPMVDWCYPGGMRFTEPFFENTMQRAMRQPYRVLFRRKTPIDALEDCAGVSPTGFIFHMSRCGSTLVSQMLAASDENVAISEAWPVDAAINADIRHPGVTDAERMQWLRGVIHALGGGRRYFVKFDATHALDLGPVRAAFPEVPWVFLYRDPVEVMVSQVQRRASWTMPGVVPIRGVALTAAAFAEHEEYIADLRAMICAAALRAAREHSALLVNYRELPGAMYQKIARHFGCTWSGDEERNMEEASRRDAKRPEQAFAADAAPKQSGAGERVREICERKLGAIYRGLEFERFRALVIDDGALQERLMGERDEEGFLNLSVALARERGCDFGLADARAAMSQARRDRLERRL